MIAVARYLLTEYFHSRRWAVPFLFLLIGLVVLYAQPPNPVLETAGTAAAFLVLAQCWFGLAFLNSQPDEDRHVLAATVHGARFLAGRVLGLGVLVLLGSLLTLGYPWIADRFDRAPGLADAGLILLANLVCAAAGSALAALFSRPTVRNRTVTVLGITACLVVSVPLGLSPAVTTATALDTAAAAHVPGRLAGTLGSVAAFVLVAAFVSGLLWRYRE